MRTASNRERGNRLNHPQIGKASRLAPEDSHMGVAKYESDLEQAESRHPPRGGKSECPPGGRKASSVDRPTRIDAARESATRQNRE